MFYLIGKYFWVLCILVTTINFYVIYPRRWRSNTVISIAMIQAIRHRIYGVAILPWVVMGFCQIVGGVPAVWSFFRPQDLNPYVWLWYITLFFISCAFTYWVFVRDGARFVMALNLIQISGFRGQIALPEKWVKVFAAFGPLFTLLWVLLAWLIDVPVVK